MDRALYIAMSGAKHTLLAQSANSNNLAHAHTLGFKTDFHQFRAMPVFGHGHPSRVYAMNERPGSDFSAGKLQPTGKALDIAINGEGWFAVRAKDGSEAYTRAGDLRITPQGLLENGAGLQLVGQQGQPIAIPPARKIEIGRDGTISVIPQGSNATTLAQIDRIKLVNPGNNQLVKREDGLMHMKQAGGPPVQPDANVNLIQGMLEGSNVNAMSAMVEMIELARNFELQTKVMKDVDENASVTAKLMQMA